MKRMKWSGTCLLVFLALALNAYATTATAPTLGAAGNFAVLAGSGITSADPGTTIVGNVGSSPTPAITGLLASQVTGTLYNTAPAVSAAVTLAQTNLTTAYNAVLPAAQNPCTPITGGTLGAGSALGSTLVPGIYCGASSVLLNGTLTLSGTSSDVWIFQIGSTLTTATGASVAFTGGASPCNVFWQVGSSATIQTGNAFAGVIMALTSITLDGGTLTGRALARNGAVTISGQESIVSGCPSSSIVLAPVTTSLTCGSGASITLTSVVLSGGIPAAAGTSVAFAITGPDSSHSGSALTNASGVATFTVASSALTSTSQTDSFSASIGTLTSNTTHATCSGSTSTAPSPNVTILNVLPGPPTQVVLSVTAPAGLFSVIVDTPPTTNLSIPIPLFVAGTTHAVGITATRINPSKPAVGEITVTDLLGHTTTFDPVFETITIPAAGSNTGKFNFKHRELARFDDITKAEGVVLLQNGTPGVDLLVISVNRSRFTVHLSDGETKQMDISSALFYGDNTVKVLAFGRPKSSVNLTISDGNGN